MRRRKERDGSTILEGDALTVGAAIGLFFPINSILMTTDNVNPGTRLPGTTWAAWGAGRAVVGVGSNGVNSYVSEQTFGADSITLSAAESGVNAHTHGTSGLTGTVSADHVHSMAGEKSFYFAGAAAPAVTDSDAFARGAATGRAFNNAIINSGNTAGISANHQHAVGAVSGASGATAHENRPSSIATYLWKRTA